jgi:hypothetical protein
MSAETKTSVNDYVWQALDAHKGCSSEEVAIYAADLVPGKELRACLAQALVHVCRELEGKSRRRSMDAALNDRPVSPKLRARASWWAQMLSETVRVNGERKVLGDCTFDDLEACIADRQHLVGHIEKQIDNYQRLQKLMLNHSAKQVSDIPPQTEWNTP